MEIINCLQQPRRKQTTRLFTGKIGSARLPKKEKIIRVKKDNVSYSVSFPKDRYSFTAGTVAQSVSPRVVLAGLGKFSSDSLSFVKNNFLKILIAVAAAAVVGAGAWFGTKFINHKITHTGPVQFYSASDSVDMENLDKFMSEFALDVMNLNSDGSLDAVENGDTAAVIFDEPVTYQTYKVKSGDTISGIALKFKLSNISSLISVNKIDNVRQLAAGQKLKIPSMDGIIYTVKSGDSVNSIIGKYKISLEALVDVNELSSEALTPGQELFIPGVGLDHKTLQKAMGELFTMPIKASFRWTSPYGWRADPFTGVRTFHTGTDMACPTGTPIYAAMSGRVTFTGVSPIWGNYVIMDHGNGYQTWYAHMSKITTAKGEWINQGGKIGLVGSTGYSTGPHLHFMVYKNGNRIDPLSVLKK